MKSNLFLATLILTSSIFIGCSKEETIESEPVQQEEPTNEFNKSITVEYSSIIQDVIQLNDSSYIMVGAEYFNFNNSNLIMKIDKFGNKEWATTMKDRHSPYGFEKVFYDNGSLMAYRSSRYSNQLGEAPEMVKFDSKGNIMDNFIIQNSINAKDIIKDNNDFIAIGTGGSLQRFAIQKINPSGVLVWNNSDGAPPCSSISKLPDGNFISIGHSNNLADNLLIKIDPFGKKIWTKQIRGRKILALIDNGFIAFIYNGFESTSIARFDEQGNEIWNYKVDLNEGINFDNSLTLINYGTNHFIFSFSTEFNRKVITYVLDKDGKLSNKFDTNLENSLINQVTITKTLKKDLFITYETNSYLNGQPEFKLNFIKIPSSEILK